MSHALRPEDDFLIPDDEDQKEPQESQVPRIIFHQPEPPSFTEACQHFAVWFATTLVGLALVAAVVSFGWNQLETLHTLPTIDFREAFTIFVIVRLTALTVRL